MSNWHTIIGIIAGFFSFMGFVPYLITLFQGKTQPNRASWWIWGTLGLILGVSYYSSGARDTMWVPAIYAICQMLIAILSLKYGKGGWNRFDRACLSAAGISLFLWWYFNSPLIAIFINLAIDSLGALPTLKKSYYEPETEDLLSWALFFTANTLNLFAVEHWSAELLAYPLYLFCLSGTIVTLLLRPKIRVKLTSRKRRWRKVGKRKKRSHFLSRKSL